MRYSENCDSNEVYMIYKSFEKVNFFNLNIFVMIWLFFFRVFFSSRYFSKIEKMMYNEVYKIYKFSEKVNFLYKHLIAMILSFFRKSLFTLVFENRKNDFKRSIYVFWTSQKILLLQYEHNTHDLTLIFFFLNVQSC